MISVAMLSFWHVHGKDYARAAAEHAETEIVAVWDEVPERGHTEELVRLGDRSEVLGDAGAASPPRL